MRAALVVVLVLAAVVAGVWWGMRLVPGHGVGSRSAEGPVLPFPAPGGSWINGAPLTADSLRGHVVVLVVWTESEPASMRVLPEAESWHRAFGRYGVRVIGVHAPAFTFAADTSVTAGVARRYGLTFPILLDPSYEVAGAPGMPELRPAVVIANPEGRMVLRATGATLERVDYELRNAIVAANPKAGLPMGIEPETSEVPSERVVHLGVSRVEHGPLAGRMPGVAATFTAQFRFQEEGNAYVPYVVGRWIPETDGVIAARGGAADYVSIRFDGGEAWAVLAPPESGASRVWILADDEWLAREEAGEDVRFDPQGGAYVEVAAPRLYSIARCPAERVLKLSPEAPGITFHSLAFESNRGRE